MDDREKLSLEAMGRFVTASEDIRFVVENRQQLYGWVSACWSSTGTLSWARRRGAWCGTTSPR
jgi:hypothetical protein